MIVSMMILFCIIGVMLLVGSLIRAKASPSWQSVAQVLGALIITAMYLVGVICSLLGKRLNYQVLCNFIGLTLFAGGYLVDSLTRIGKRGEDAGGESGGEVRR